MGETLFDQTRGIKGRVRYRQCKHRVWVIDNYEHKDRDWETQPQHC